MICCHQHAKIILVAMQLAVAVGLTRSSAPNVGPLGKSTPRQRGGDGIEQKLDQGNEYGDESSVLAEECLCQGQMRIGRRMKTTKRRASPFSHLPPPPPSLKASRATRQQASRLRTYYPFQSSSDVNVSTPIATRILSRSIPGCIHPDFLKADCRMEVQSLCLLIRCRA